MTDDHTEATARRRAVVVAGHRGDAGTARSALDDEDPGVRASALAALARCDELNEAELVRALGDPAVEVRRRAALVAANRDDAAAELAALLDDPDATVVEVAAFACGERNDATASVVERLVALSGAHEDALCREAAVAALGSIGAPEGLPAVLAACEDRATVRRRAVLALAAFDGPEVSAMLERLTEDRDLQVRQAAEELLAIEQGEQL
jgi:HEAT repeat protein